MEKVRPLQSAAASEGPAQSIHMNADRLLVRRPVEGERSTKGGLLIPATAALLGSHWEEPIALALYAVNLLLVIGSLWVLWRLASSGGHLRQDGLAYLATGDNSGSARTGAFTPDLQTLWVQSLNVQEVYSGTLADLLGLGRPQLVSNSHNRAFVLQDGRDGRLLLPVPSAEDSGGGLTGNYTHHTDRPPVVAATTGGRSAW